MSATFFIFFLGGNIVFSLGFTFYFLALLEDVTSNVTINAFFHNVSSVIYVAVQGGALGLFCAFITIIIINWNQENNVSFYKYTSIDLLI